MNDEETKGEGEETESAPEKDGGEQSRAAQALNYAKKAGQYWAHIARTKWFVVLLLAASLILFLVTIVFVGVWAGAIKGYFGERLHQDAAADDPARETINDIKNKSPQKLREAPHDRQVESVKRSRRPAGATGEPTPRPSPPPPQKFCQLVIPDSLDRQFLEDGYTFTGGAIGAAEGTTIQPDQGMLESMQYLCERHRRLGISHIISAYVNMRLDPEQQESRDPQIIKNISAHNRGQAYDLVEIDFVYKVYRPGACTLKGIVDVYYYNDEGKLLLYLPCKEKLTNVNTTFQGFPAQAIPVQVVWQDQPNQFALGGLPLNIDTALRLLAPHLGLPPEALRFVGRTTEEALTNIGRAYLTELLGLPAGSLAGNDLAGMLRSAFEVKLAELLNQFPRPEWGRNLPDWVRSAGAGWLEQALGLFPGSLQGWNSREGVFRSIALETAANILRIPSDILKDPTKAAAYLASLSQADLDYLARDPLGARLVAIIDALRRGDVGAANGALQAYGQQILEQTLNLPEGALTCVASGRQSCPDPLATLAQLAERTGLNQDTLRTFISLVRDGGSLANLLEHEGGPLLERSLGLPSGTLSRLLSGQAITFDQATIQNVARKLGIDPALAQSLLSAFQQGQDLLRVAQQVGSTILGQAFNLSDPLALFKVVTGVAPDELIKQVEQELKNLAEKLNLPPELIELQKLLSGDIESIASLFQRLGGFQLGEIFGVPLSDILRLVRGDLSVLLNLPAVQDLLKSIAESLGLGASQVADLLRGNPLVGDLANLGNALNGLMSALGVDQALVFELVYRPEARRKVHTVIRELLDMPFVLDDIDLRVTQIITYSHERDVRPFEQDGTLDKVYGKGRSKNFGLFAMEEAYDHLHIGY